MRRVVLSVVLFHVLVPVAFGRYQSALDPSKCQQSLLARVTVYWAKGGSGSDRYTRLHKCATGVRLQNGHCAVDPEQIPYGSQVLFPDGTSLAAVDTGTAVKNRKAARRAGRTAYERNAIVIDRFFESKRQALSWADRNPLFMTVRVVPPNQRAQVPLTRQSPPRAVAVTLPVVNKLKPTRPLFADSSSISRNPLNKLSR
jgi:hypothetical protein